MDRRMKDGYSCDNILTQLHMYMASIGEAMQSEFAASIISRFCFADFFTFSLRRTIRCAVTVGDAHYKREKNNVDLVAAFCLAIGTSIINLALHGGNVIE
jgi:hypothetical protein